MRTAAQVDERFAVAIHAHRVTAGHLARIVGIGIARGDSLNDLALVGLIGEQRECILGRHLGTNEGLIGLDDLAHSFADCSQVVFGERTTIRQVEVVIETVLNGRADGELGPRKQLQDRLRKDVGRGVSQYVTTGVGVGRDDRNVVAGCQGRTQIRLAAVHHCRHGSLRQT